MKASPSRSVIRRINLTLVSVLCSMIVFATPDYNFSSSVLLSGSANSVGAVYRFQNVKPGIDAIVTITNITNGLNIQDIDGTSGFAEALQPVIQVPGNTNGYAEFRIDFVIANTFTPSVQPEVPITAIDVDGKKSGTKYVYEYDEVQVRGSSYIQFDGASPELKLSFRWGWVRGENILGVDYPGVDTVARQVMFSVVNASISSIIVRVGANNTTNGTEQRLRSFYFQKFIFPNSVLPLSTVLDFNGAVTENKCRLSWSLMDNNNASTIVLERGNSSNSFSPVAEYLVNFDGNHQNNFNYTDNVAGAVVYYRLKVTDASGKVEYSNILSFKTTETGARNLKVYPTLVDAAATASVYAEKSQSALLKWIDMSGKIMQQQTISLQKGTNSLQIAKQGNLPRGNYIIAVVADGRMMTDRVVVR